MWFEFLTPGLARLGVLIVGGALALIFYYVIRSHFMKEAYAKVKIRSLESALRASAKMTEVIRKGAKVRAEIAKIGISRHPNFPFIRVRRKPQRKG